MGRQAASYIPLHPDSLRHPEYQQLLNDVLATRTGWAFLHPLELNSSRYSTINEVVTVAGSDNRTLVLTSNLTMTGTAVTIPATLKVKPMGGLIQFDSSTQTITWNSEFPADTIQCFSDSAATPDYTKGVRPAAGTVRVIHPTLWGPNTTPGTTDMLLPIRSAIAAAKATLGSITTGGSGANERESGGVVVRLLSGIHKTTSYIEIPDACTLEGAGKFSTVIRSSYDGQTIRNEVVTGIYGYRGIAIRNLTVEGDRTKTSQVLIDLLRTQHGTFENLRLIKSGGNGLNVRQIIASNFTNIDSMGNVGHGVYIVDGINSWTDTTDNDLPTNDSTFINLCSVENDGAGVYFAGEANGNVFIGGYIERNYLAAGDNAGYQVYLGGNADRNLFMGVWFEGPAEAHVYSNTTTNGFANRLINCVFVPKGATGAVDRAAIAYKGILIIENPMAQASPFKTLGSSSAPFRVNTSGGGKIYLSGKTMTGTSAEGFYIDDQNNSDLGLQQYAYEDTWTGIRRRLHGGLDIYAESGVIAGRYYAASASAHDTEPWLQLASRAISLGPGSAAVDLTLSSSSGKLLAKGSGLQLQSSTANTGGGLQRIFAEATSGALSGASGSIAVNVPSGSRILGVQLRVDTAITSGDGGTTWAAVYVNTPTTAITTGRAFTKNTKFNAIHPAYEITTGTVTITLTPDAGTFSGGDVRAVVYYENFVALGNNP